MELPAFCLFFYARDLFHHNLMDIENLFREKVARYIQLDEAIGSIHIIKINRLSIRSI